MPEIKLPENPAVRRPLPRLDDLHGEEARQYFRAREPFIARDSKLDVSRFTREGITNLCGDIEFDTMEIEDMELQYSGAVRTIDSRMKHPPRTPGKLKVSDWVKISESLNWKMKYGIFGPEFNLIYPGRHVDSRWRRLTHGVVVPDFVDPEYLALALFAKPSMAIEPTEEQPYVGTPCHVDDFIFDFLYWQTEGSKHITLFHPDMAPYLSVEPEGYMFPHASVWCKATEKPAEYPDLANAWCYEALIEPGDVVFWPGFWYHWFVHEPVYQLALRALFSPAPVHHKLTCASSAWAFSQGMAKALGGLATAEEEFNKLPEETQALLKKIEHALLSTPDLLDPRNNYVEKYANHIPPGKECIWGRSRDRFKLSGR